MRYSNDVNVLRKNKKIIVYEFTMEGRGAFMTDRNILQLCKWKLTDEPDEFGKYALVKFD